MPRAARIKQYNYIYHVMSRSISDVPLFRDNQDKDTYLDYIKKYQEKFMFKVYAYCLMTTHVHLIIDSNGADISKIMHGVNQRYAQYFNRRYKRHGHVFQDRFKSIVVHNEEYIVTLSAYIHNNPTDIKKYRDCPEKFKYSTLGVYLGLRTDQKKIVDEDFVMSLFSSNVKKARENYLKLVYAAGNMDIKSSVEFKNEKSQYRSERVIIRRDHTPEDIMNFIEKHLKVDKRYLHMKHRRCATEARAICVFLIHSFCDYNYKDICRVIGNLTLSRISKLCNKGLELIKGKEEYKEIIDKFLDNAA